GAVGGVGDAVAIEIERRIVAPVVAAAALRPVEIAGADILHLVAVADEGVAGDLVALGAGREMHADAAALEPVVAKLVVVGVVDKDAFPRSAAQARFGFWFGQHAALFGRTFVPA